MAVFVRDEKPLTPTIADSSITIGTEPVEEEESSTVFEEHNTLVRSHIVPRWVLRFSSKVEASAWMAEAQRTATALHSASRVWLVTEQSEVFWAVGTSLDSLTWNRVSVGSCFVISLNL